MGDNIDDLKGKAKEAFGDATGDESTKRSGQADQAGAKVKGAADDAKDKAGDLVDKAKDALKRD